MKHWALSAVLCLCAAAAQADCAPDRVKVQGDWGQATFTVSVVDTPQTRARGLMFVPQMPVMAGMLFVYEQPQPVSFWMKNTLIPLDMLFAGPDGAVLHVHENAVPGDLTPIPGGDGVIAVLEINGGMAARLGIAAGDVMQHPSFGAQAILPCVQNSDG